MDDLISRIAPALEALQGGGWETDMPQNGQWTLTREGVTLYAGINPHWLYFSVPVTARAADEDYLRRGMGLYMAKYSRDAAGQLVIQCELPIPELDRTYIHTAVEALSRAVAAHESVGVGAEPSPEPMVREGAGVEFFPRHTLDQYFKSLRHIGWGYRKPVGANSYHFHYKAPERPFEVYLSFNRAWAYYHIALLDPTIVQAWQAGNHRAAFARFLLGLNAQIYWGRFGLDGEGQAVLTLDVPLQLFTAERFRLAGSTLATYASDYAYEVQIMAGLGQDASLAALVGA